MNEKPFGHLLHVSVSNQSFAVREAELEVKVNGRSVFRRVMAVGMQHTWEQFDVAVEPGPCSVEAAEATTGASRRVGLQIEHDLWLTVTFNSPPPEVSVNVSDRQVGML